jgi:hypothetical protein
MDQTKKLVKESHMFLQAVNAGLQRGTITVNEFDDLSMDLR